MQCTAAAWAAFQDAKPPFYFFGVHFVGVNASPGQKLIFQATQNSNIPQVGGQITPLFGDIFIFCQKSK